MEDGVTMQKKGDRQDWITPVSGFRFLSFESLIDNGKLEITVANGSVNDGRSYCFKWNRFYAYRNTLEEHGLPWDLDTSGSSKSGNTNKVLNSLWISSIREVDGYLDMLEENAQHFVIYTTDYVIEVMASSEPDITELIAVVE